MANILEKFRDQIIAKVNYEHVRSLIIANGLVSEAEDNELRQITTTTEQMAKFLDLVSFRPTAVDAVISSLEMCDQRKFYGDLSNKLLTAKFSP